MSEVAPKNPVALIRGIPWEGRRWRWAGGLPWPAREVRVEIVDEAVPFDAAALAKKHGLKDENDAVPEFVTHAQLAEIRNDARIAVQITGEDALESLHKADMAKAQADLTEARRQLAEVAEEKARNRDINDLARERGQKLSDAEAEIVRLRADLEATRSKRKG